MVDAKLAVIVGASRGLGLGLAREFRRREWRTIGTVRDPADAQALVDLGAHVEPLDVRDESAREKLVAALAGKTLDVLFLNAGVYGPRDFLTADAEAVDAVMQANAFGPAKLAHRLAPQVRQGSGVIGFMTSGMGSISDNTSGGSEVYRASKAAQNMLARGLWVDRARDRGVAVLSVNPGWVKTDMGGSGASLDVETSARGIADQLEAAAGHNAHRFVNWDGRELAW